MAGPKDFPPQFCHQIIWFVETSLQAPSFLASKNYFMLVVTLGSAGWCWRMSAGFRALTTKDWSCCSWGAKLSGYVQQSLDAWGRINFYRLSKRTAFLAGLLMPRTWLCATMMNAIKANQKHEAVQAEGFCYCGGNGPIAPVIILMDGLA